MVESFRASILVIGFIAIGFAVGWYWAKYNSISQCPAPWNVIA